MNKILIYNECLVLDMTSKRSAHLAQGIAVARGCILHMYRIISRLCTIVRLMKASEQIRYLLDAHSSFFRGADLNF